MDLDRAVAGSSSLHRADPRLKLVATIATILAVSMLPIGSFAALAVMLLALTVASTIAGLGPWRLMRGSFVAAPFLLAAIPIIFVGDGEVLARLGPLEASTAGVARFATVVAKSWLSVQAALLLTYTTPFHDLIDALRDLRVPRILVEIIGFMYRYLAVIGDEAARMLRARSARSAEAGTGASGPGVGWRARTTGLMVGSLFLRSYERSERIYAAMLSRGFDGTFRHLADRSISRGAWVATGLLFAGLVTLELAAHGLVPGT
jgi:cobalt/nickel transport system permease protein